MSGGTPRFEGTMVEPWESRSLCSEHLEIDFFALDDHLEVARAKAVCADCPVSQECLEWARTHPAYSSFAIAGGMTPKERRAGGGARGVPLPIAHGEPSGYDPCRRAGGGVACRACLKANATRKAAYRAANRDRINAERRAQRRTKGTP